MSANSWLACAACSCLLLGCSSLRLANSVALPTAAPGKAPLTESEAKAAVQRIDSVRDQAQCTQALALWKQGKAAESRRLLEQVIVRTPDHSQARLLLADLALEAGQTQEAEQLLVSLLRDHPDDESARAALAWLYESQGRGQEAQPLFQQLDENFSPEA
jgi:predicted Zn-dependent protease